jgi:hypothetical protein
METNINDTIYKKQSLHPIMRQMDRVHTLTFSNFNIYFIIIIFVACLKKHLHNSDNTASDGRVISELWIWKDLEGNNRGLILGCYVSTRLERLMKTMKYLGEDNRSPSRDLNYRPPPPSNTRQEC